MGLELFKTTPCKEHRFVTDATLMHSFLCDLRLPKLFDVLAYMKIDVSYNQRLRKDLFAHENQHFLQSKGNRKNVLTHLSTVAGAHMGAKVAVVEAPAFTSVITEADAMYTCKQ